VGRPDRPVVGVGAVVIDGGRVLLIQRGKEPLRGRWVVPGGTVELGESLQEALVREIREETGIEVHVREPVLVFDRILRDEAGVRYHYVIVDYLCGRAGGETRAGSDALDAAWATPSELAGYELPPAALEVVVDGFLRSGVALPDDLLAVARRPVAGRLRAVPE
jgi:8-oxo-dGTP diphosphatase